MVICRVAGAGLALAALLAAAATAQPCSVHAEIEPAQAVVGQQVTYRLLIRTVGDVDRVDWVEPPSFPGFRADWLPGRPERRDPTRAGVDGRVREERRALFPARPGTLVVRSPAVRCTVAGEEPRVAPVPDAVVSVTEPPATGRPDAYTGLVGPLQVHVNVDAHARSLGETVRVAVLLRGGGNLWDAPSPFPVDDAFGAAEVFRRRSELQSDAGDRLSLRRSFAFDVVPHAAGALVVPAVAIPYLDPRTGRYAIATAPGVSIPIGPRRTSTAPPTVPPEPPPRAPELAPGRSRTWTGVTTLTAGAAALVAAIAGVTFRRRRRYRGVRDALDSAEAARNACDDAAERSALARALRAALAVDIPEAPNLAAEELLARTEGREPLARVARLLDEVERARFDPAGSAVDRNRVKRALDALRRPSPLSLR